MSAAVSRAVMALAARCLGPRRREWALAMRAEHEEALRNGGALSFSVGCLLAAWRELPAHGEGRLLLARHALVLGLVMPVAAALLSAAPFGGPCADPLDLVPGGAGCGHLLNDGNRAAAAVLVQLLAAIAAAHLAVAWAVLDRDWTRVAALGRLGAASATALVMLSCLAFLDATRALPPVAALVAEALAVCALVRLHAEPAFGGDAHAGP